MRFGIANIYNRVNEIDGVTAIIVSNCSVKITSNKLAGNIVFYATGSYVFSKESDKALFSFHRKKVSISELVEKLILHCKS